MSQQSSHQTLVRIVGQNKLSFPLFVQESMIGAEGAKKKRAGGLVPQSGGTEELFVALILIAKRQTSFNIRPGF